MMNTYNKKTMWLTVIATCASLASVAAMAEKAELDQQQVQDHAKPAQFVAQIKHDTQSKETRTQQ